MRTLWKVTHKFSDILISPRCFYSALYKWYNVFIWIIIYTRNSLTRKGYWGRNAGYLNHSALDAVPILLLFSRNHINKNTIGRYKFNRIKVIQYHPNLAFVPYFVLKRDTTYENQRDTLACWQINVWKYFGKFVSDKNLPLAIAIQLNLQRPF